MRFCHIIRLLHIIQETAAGRVGVGVVGVGRVGGVVGETGVEAVGAVCTHDKAR